MGSGCILDVAAEGVSGGEASGSYQVSGSVWLTCIEMGKNNLGRENQDFYFGPSSLLDAYEVTTKDLATGFWSLGEKLGF